jgi:central kinetochore subunit Mal2/MCM21
MSLRASDVPNPELTEAQSVRIAQLESEIELAQLDIDHITSRHAILAGSLLNTSAIREQLQQYHATSSDQSLADLLQKSKSAAQANSHRLAFGVTAFPFTDPSDEASRGPLLGIRFDVPRRDGSFDSPQYIICKRCDTSSSDVAIYKHTIPAFVHLEKYTDTFLPSRDEGYGSSDDSDTVQQNLQAFVDHVRSDLVGWRLRMDAIEALRKELGLDQAVDRSNYGVTGIEATAVDATYVRIVWDDGRVGRVQLDNSATITKAVVYKAVDGQDQRCSRTESILLRASGLDQLAQQLRHPHKVN